MCQQISSYTAFLIYDQNEVKIKQGLNLSLPYTWARHWYKSSNHFISLSLCHKNVNLALCSVHMEFFAIAIALANIAESGHCTIFTAFLSRSLSFQCERVLRSLIGAYFPYSTIRFKYGFTLWQYNIIFKGSHSHHIHTCFGKLRP